MMAYQNGLAGWDVLKHGNGFMGELSALLSCLFRFFAVAVNPGLFSFLMNKVVLIPDVSKGRFKGWPTFRALSVAEGPGPV